MKTILLTFSFACLLSLPAFAQGGISVNTTGTAPDNSAMLDVQSTTKGILIPRMTQAQRTAIASPATGLMVYQTNNTTGFYYYNGSAWASIGAGSFTETDPKVATTTTGRLARWNGTALADGLLFDDGVRLSVGSTNPSFGNDFNYGLLNLANSSSANTDFNNILASNSYFSPYINWGKARGSVSSPTIVQNGDDLFRLNASGHDGTQYKSTMSMSVFVDGVPAANSIPSRIAFSTTAVGNTSPTERMRITNAGLVGVGTTSPADRLHIVGKLRIDAGKIDFRNTGNSVFIGENAGLNDDLTTNDNTFVGYRVGQANSIGNSNVGVGTNSLLNSLNSNNTAIGAYTAEGLTSGYNNIAIGESAMRSSTTAYRNVTIGASALRNNIAGFENTAIGFSAGQNATGSANIFLGNLAGQNETGSNKLYIDNSNTATPLLYGEFDNNLLRVNGTLNVNNAYSLPTIAGTANQYLQTNGAGVTSWVTPSFLSTETDPKVGTLTTNYLPKWNGTSLANGLLFDNGTNVGIGTTAPGQKLDVNGNIRGTNLYANSYLQTGSILPNTVNPVATFNTGSTMPVLIGESTANKGILIGRLGNDIQGRSNANFTSNDDLLLNPSGGNVGIGTTSPTAKLDVAGTTKTTNLQMTTGATNGYVLQSDASGNGTWVNPTSLPITESDPKVGTLTTNYLPKWNGTSLANGLLFDDGTNVGIGTTTPSQKLDVNGSINVSDNYLFTNTSGTGSSNPQFRLDGFSDKLYVIAESNATGPAGTEIRFRTASAAANATDRVTIDKNGNVGIGSTSPNAPLVVAKTVTNEGILRVHNGSSAANTKSWIGFSADNVFATNDANDRSRIGVEIQSSGAGALFFTTGGYNNQIERMRINQHGNVGIGTASPTEKLEVVGKTKTDNLQMITGATNGYVLQSDASGNGTWVNPTSLPITESDPKVATTTTGRLARWNGTSLVDGLLFDNGTNVGLGTALPTEKLHISGGSIIADRATVTSSTTRSLTLGGARGLSGTDFAQINFQNYDSSTGSVDYVGAKIASQNTASTDDGDLRFSTNNGTLTERMIIDNDGNVGIGTSSPTYNLDVTGTNAILQRLNSSSTTGTWLNMNNTSVGGTDWNLISTGSGNSEGAGNFLIRDGSTVRMTFLSTNGNVGIGTTSPADKLHVVGNARIDAGRLDFRNTGESVFVGQDAGLNDDFTNNNNVAVGFEALKANTDGSFNVGIGYQALTANTLGVNNVALGYGAGKSIIGSDNNVFIGTHAGTLNTGDGNVFVGNRAGINNAGSDNVFIGNRVGENETGSNKLYIDNSNTSTPLIWGDFTSNYVNINGNLGIGTNTPSTKLHVSNGDARLDRGTNTAGIGRILTINGARSGQGSNFAQLNFENYDNNNGLVDYVGASIGSQNTGSIDAGDLRFSTNNGTLTERMIISKDGYVGIGTSSPTQATLVVNGSQNFTTAYGYLNSAGATGTFGSATNAYSIYASARIAASEFNAYSDARIKKIKGLSNSSKDLTTLANIKITDYTHIDSIAKGNKEVKKVIAQELKTVYPQAVSTMTDVVPDIYQQASINNEGFVSLPTNLKAGEKVKIIFATGEEILEVTGVQETGFRVNSDKAGKVFVYGRQVNDFHVVDYEALSTLNISATQALLKKIEALERQVNTLQIENAKITDLEKQIKEIQASLNQQVKR